MDSDKTERLLALLKDIDKRMGELEELIQLFPDDKELSANAQSLLANHKKDADKIRALLVRDK